MGRFALLIGAVALLVILLLFFQAVAGTLTSGLTGGLDSTSADVLVYDDRARLNPFSSVIDPALIEQVASQPDVAAAAPIAISVFIGSSEGSQIDVALVGGEPQGPSVPAELAEGRLPENLGEALFSGSSFDKPFEIGQSVTLDGGTFEVVGIADDAAFNVLPTFYVFFDDYVALSQTRAGSPIGVPASLIGVAVADGADASAVATQISEEVPGLEAVDRKSAVEALPGVGQITQSFSILYLLLYIVVTIVTGVFFLILTVQKRDSLVLLRAVGASSRDVLTSVLIQVLIVVGAGAVLGSIVTAGLLSATREVFGAGLSLSTTAFTIAIIVALGLLASVGALRRVMSIDPVEATATRGI